MPYASIPAMTFDQSNLLAFGDLPAAADLTSSDLVLLTDGVGAPLAIVNCTDPLASDQPYAAGRSAIPAGVSGHVVLRSGPRPGDGLSWLPGSRAAFAEFVRGVDDVIAERGGGVVPVIWPHAGGVISDIPSIQTFMRGAIDRSWRWVFDPALLLTDSMHAMGGDHFRRMFELLGPIPGLALFIEDETWRGAWPAAWGSKPTDGGPGHPWLNVPRLVRHARVSP